jgi:hypothetical protein
MQQALSEWAIHFLKNKDIVQKKLESVYPGEARIDVKYKAGETGVYFIEPSLSDGLAEKIPEGECFVVCLNRKDNLAFLVKNWDSFTKYRKLCFIFVNPELNERWIIFPHTHNLITDRPALKKGLEALFASVAEAAG